MLQLQEIALIHSYTDNNDNDNTNNEQDLKIVPS